MIKRNGIKYNGSWQYEDAILQRLEGPYGKGSVEYPNGDRFEGFFHLSYAHINGPAYAAAGRFEFADGSVIEHAWINTSYDLKVMDLIGVYLVKHPNGPDTLTPFDCHKRNGIEVVLDKNPYAIEWCEDEKLQELAMESYTLNQIDADRSVLTIILKDGTTIQHYSGDLESNKYDKMVFRTYFKSVIHYPDNTSVDCFGYNLKYLKPYDGYITFHSLNGKYHEEEWSDGKMVHSLEEKWDDDAAKTIELPEPFNKNNLMTSKVWNGHIDYYFKTWIYDGEMKDDRPDGYGVLVGSFANTRGRRYEGEFKDGLCHGIGEFTYPEAGIRQFGEWVEGVFKEKEEDAPTEPIMLHVVLSGDSSDDQMVEAKVGTFPHFTGFGGLRIDRIEKSCITFSYYGDIHKLTPGETLHLDEEIDGPEDSQGCVYESYDYYLRITWKK